MRGFFFKKLFLFLLCALFVSSPFLVFSQEVAPPAEPAPTTENPVENTDSAPAPLADTTSETTTSESSTENTSDNSTTDQSYFIDNTKPEEERVLETSTNILDQSYTVIHKETTEETTIPETPEVLGESTSEPTPVSTPIAETPAPEEPKPIIVPKKVEAPEEIPLSELTRVYDKEIFVNKDAKHECHAEFFRVDMSERSSALNTIIFTKEADISYEMEIGSLPIGVDIRFSESNSYHKNLGSEDESIDISISKESDAPKGDFSVPIIYTQKGVFDSSVICQLNIVNL